MNWFKKKSKIERLKTRYTLLMRQSYKTALCDIKKSKEAHTQAEKLLEEIQNLSKA